MCALIVLTNIPPTVNPTGHLFHSSVWELADLLACTAIGHELFCGF